MKPADGDPAVTEPSAEVSIVVTTFNHARFLREALASVMDQTRPASEIIVVDDGSSDSPELVTAEFPGVHLIQQANQGLSSARNAGLRTTMGRFLVFLDADDRLLPTAIEHGLQCFRQNPDCGLVYGAYHDIDERGERVRTRRLREIEGDPFLALMPGNLIEMHATVMYRRECLVEIGGFDTRLKSCEDFDVFLRMALKYRFACHGSHVAEYRRHRGGKSRNSARVLRAALYVLAKQERTARSRREWSAGLEQARASWREHYGAQQARKLRECLESKRLSWLTVRDSAAMFLLAPGVMIRGACKPPKRTT